MQILKAIAKFIGKGIAATLIIIGLYLTLTIQNNPTAQETASFDATIYKEREKTYNVVCKKGVPVISQISATTVSVKCKTDS